MQSCLSPGFICCGYSEEVHLFISNYEHSVYIMLLIKVMFAIVKLSKRKFQSCTTLALSTTHLGRKKSLVPQQAHD